MLWSGFVISFLGRSKKPETDRCEGAAAGFLPHNFYLQSPRELRYLLIAVVVGLWLAFFVYCEVRFQRFLKLNRATTHSTLPPESIQIIH